MKREFNEDTLKAFIEHSTKGRFQWDDFNDSFKRWLDQFEQHADPSLRSNLNNYSNGLTEALFSSEARIKKIFADVKEVDNAYAARLSDAAFDMELFAGRASALRDVIKTPDGSCPFLSPLFTSRLSDAKAELEKIEEAAFVARNAEVLAEYREEVMRLLEEEMERRRSSFSPWWQEEFPGLTDAELVQLCLYAKNLERII